MITASKPARLDTAIREQLGAALLSAAKEAGLSISKDHLTCELGTGFTIVTAPIARPEIPTEKELSTGVGLAFAYLSHAGNKQIPAGFYTIKVTTNGYRFSDGTVKISFVDAQGKTAHAFYGESAQLQGPAQDVPTVEDFAARSLTHGIVCGSRKCFKWDRVGRGKWEYGCVDFQGNTVDCI
jgi:hypothetical protein